METVKPPFRWVGSKRRYAKAIVDHFPEKISSFCEPFVGSGAVLIELINQGRLVPGARVWLGDQGPVRAFWEVMVGPDDDFEDLCDEFTTLHLYFSDNPEGWYTTLKKYVKREDAMASAAFLALNQTAFSGLWRVNRAGEFNVPRDPSKMVIRDVTPNLRALREVLQQYDVRIIGDLWEIDFVNDLVVYADPPYCDTFAGYGAGGFGRHDHERLAVKLFHRWVFGAEVFLSNSDCLLTHELYPLEDHWREVMKYGRTNGISSDGATRKEKRGEVLLRLMK